jgi:uncharacterized protein
MFGTGLSVALLIMNAYFLWRVISTPIITHRVPRWIFFLASGVLCAAFFLGHHLGRSAPGPFTAALELVGMDWMASLLLICVCLLAVDLVTGFGLLFRRVAPLLRSAALVAGTMLAVLAMVQGMRSPVVQEYEVRLKGLPQELDGTVVVAMSDFHLGSLIGRRWLEARVSQVQTLRPDLVVFIGDIIEGHGQSPAELVPVLRRFCAPMGVWAVLGNHEFFGGGDSSASLLADANIRVLRNRWAEVRPGLILAGVDDLTGARRSGQSGDFVAHALAARPPGATILLSHTPWRAEEAAGYGVGLMLCAHTHGGQIWPLGYLVRTRYPLLAGWYEVGGMPAIVTRGAGTWGPRMRLWHPGEIARITLRRGG